ARHSTEERHKLRLAHPDQREWRRSDVGTAAQAEGRQEESQAPANRRHRPGHEEGYREARIEGGPCSQRTPSRGGRPQLAKENEGEAPVARSRQSSSRRDSTRVTQSWGPGGCRRSLRDSGTEVLADATEVFAPQPTTPTRLHYLH